MTDTNDKPASARARAEAMIAGMAKADAIAMEDFVILRKSDKEAERDEAERISLRVFLSESACLNGLAHLAIADELAALRGVLAGGRDGAETRRLARAAITAWDGAGPCYKELQALRAHLDAQPDAEGRGADGVTVSRAEWEAAQSAVAFVRAKCPANGAHVLAAYDAATRAREGGRDG